jgi:hypothetical protein
MTADAAEPDVAPQSRAKVSISYSRKDMSRGFEPLITASPG